MYRVNVSYLLLLLINVGMLPCRIVVGADGKAGMNASEESGVLTPWRGTARKPFLPQRR